MSAGGAPREWDFTLLPFSGIIFPLLDAVGASAVVEVGADRGDFTRALLDWAADSGARVTAIDPEPAPELLELADEHPELVLVREPSPEALVGLPLPEVLILDGDHNHYTLSRELELIAERSIDPAFPLSIVHDVGWPHARRDTYYSPERIPAERRQPLVHEAMIAPGDPGTGSSGLRFEWAAGREGGPRNGVLTAVEDFLQSRPELRFAVIPAFFGLGVLWPRDAEWAGAIAQLVEPWESSPLLARLEEVRLSSIVDRTRLGRQEAVLRALLGSRAFAVAERLSRLRNKGDPPVSRERVRRALGR